MFNFRNNRFVVSGRRAKVAMRILAGGVPEPEELFGREYTTLSATSGNNYAATTYCW
jgi:hypothetical protein